MEKTILDFAEEISRKAIDAENEFRREAIERFHMEYRRADGGEFYFSGKKGQVDILRESFGPAGWYFLFEPHDCGDRIRCRFAKPFSFFEKYPALVILGTGVPALALFIWLLFR